MKPFKSVAAAITLSTTAALAPGFTAQAEAQAQPIQVTASQIPAYDSFARSESNDEVVVMIVQPVGGDPEALEAIERALDISRSRGVSVASFVIEAEGHRGTDIYGFAAGYSLFDYENYDVRDIRGQSGIMRRDIQSGWEHIQERQARTAARADSEGRDPR